MTSAPETVHKFESLISSFRDGMLVTHSSEGLRARPMHLLKRDNEENLWLATGSHSAKVEEIKKDQRCCITFQEGSKYISVSGIANVVQDKKKATELWNEALRIYFPDGPGSEEMCLLRIDSQCAEYWDLSGPMKKLQFAFEAGKAYLRGEHVNPEAAAPHEQVKLK